MHHAALAFGLALAAAHVLLACNGCSSLPSPVPTTPRGQARAVILVVSGGVTEADKRCSEEADKQKSVSLAERCGDAYKRARASLLAAGAVVDAYDQGSKNDVQCATVAGLGAARELAEALKAYGATVPPALEDGLELAKALSLTCKPTADAGDAS